MLVVVLIVLILLVALIGGATASLLCLVLERRAAGRSIRGRSVCACGTPIPLYRNIPVVSWVVQRGRAHCCGARIPRWYVGAEALMAVGTGLGLLLGGALGAGIGLVGMGVVIVGPWSQRSRS